MDNYKELKVKETVSITLEDKIITLEANPAVESEENDILDDILGPPCHGCFFNKEYCTKIDLSYLHKLQIGSCNGNLRDDHQDIIFTKVKEEPILQKENITRRANQFPN